jgi:hypothetical protein
MISGVAGQQREHQGSSSPKMVWTMIVTAWQIIFHSSSERVSHFCVKLNASWRVRGGNGEVILAVSEGLEDIGIKAVWMNKWMGVWIGFTFIWLKRG